MAQLANGSNGAPHANGKASYAEKHNIADHFIGGSRLENAPESKVKDFVAQNDGHTVITNVSYHFSGTLESNLSQPTPNMLTMGVA